MVRLPLFVELIPKNLKSFKKDVQVETTLFTGGRKGGLNPAAEIKGIGGITKGVTEGKTINMGMLGKMAGILGGVAIIASALMSMKPVTAMIEMVTKIISLFLLPFVMMAFRLLKPFLIGMLKLMMLWYKFWQDPVGNLSKLFDGIVESLTNLGGFIVSGLMSILSGVGEGIANLGQGILNTAGDIFSGLAEAGNQAKTMIGGFIEDTFGETAKKHYDNVFTKAMEVISGIGSFMDHLLKGNFKLAFQDILGIGKSVLEMLQSILLLEIDVFKGIGTWIWNGLTSIFTKSFDVLSDLGSNISKWIMKQLDNLNPFSPHTENVHDFILSGGKLIKTDPQDTIIGTKTPGMGGETNIPTQKIQNTNLYIQGVLDENMLWKIGNQLKNNWDNLI